MLYQAVQLYKFRKLGLIDKEKPHKYQDSILQVQNKRKYIDLDD